MFINDEDIALFYPLPFHVYWKDNEGYYRGCNDYQAMNLGFKSGSEIIGFRDLDLPWKKEQALQYRKNDITTVSNKSPMLVKEPISLKGGSNFEALSYKIPLHDASMNIKGILGFTLLTEVSTHLQLLSQLAAIQTESMKRTVLKGSEEKSNIKTATFNFTVRQIDCLFYLVKGFSIKQIAEKLKLSPRTIEHYLENIKAKLNCNTRSDLIEIALKIPSIQDKLLEYIS